MPSRKSPALSPSQQTIAYLRRSLNQIERDVRAATKSASWQAVFAGKRLALSVRRDLDAAEKECAPATGDLDSLSEADYRERLHVEAEGMPDDYLEIYVRTYCDRHGVPLPS